MICYVDIPWLQMEAIVVMVFQENTCQPASVSFVMADSDIEISYIN